MAGFEPCFDDGSSCFPSVSSYLYPSVLNPDRAHTVCKPSYSFDWCFVASLLHHDAVSAFSGAMASVMSCMACTMCLDHAIDGLVAFPLPLFVRGPCPGSRHCALF